MLTPQEHAIQAKRVREAVQSGSLETADRKTLVEYSTWLCEPGATDAFNNAAVYEQSCELVRLHMLRSMIDAFETRSKVQGKWVLFFAVLAIVAQVLPYIIAPNPMFGAKPSPTESTAKTDLGLGQHPTLAAPAPTQVQPPSSGPTIATQGSGATKK